MYFLRYQVLPGADHPEADRMGEGLVCCWVDRPSLAEADAVARADITGQGWDILGREAGEEVTAADYEPDHEWLPYYEQALTDGEVFVYHTSPRHPVYWVSAIVTRASPPETAEAHYFLCGEAVAEEGDDIYDPAFWGGDRGRAAAEAAREVIAAEGWTVAGSLEGRPCERDDPPEDLVEFYDAAEDDGSCLVFLRDEGAPPE
jgi:hypothetical protein